MFSFAFWPESRPTLIGQKDIASRIALQYRNAEKRGEDRRKCLPQRHRVSELFNLRNPELGELCVSVVNNFPSVLSLPLCRTHSIILISSVFTRVLIAMRRLCHYFVLTNISRWKAMNFTTSLLNERLPTGRSWPSNWNGRGEC
jgi:hypothetical protein